jgi:hypothetical protein
VLRTRRVRKPDIWRIVRASWGREQHQVSRRIKSYPVGPEMTIPAALDVGRYHDLGAAWPENATALL